jgi:2,3-dihydroxyphenylpropionate 1,2-dioxygenase
MLSAKLQCLSHTPLIGHVDPPDARKQAALSAVARLRSDLRAFDPELIFLFAPDHYNGFFYDLMPPFCIGAQATAIGDWWGLAGPLNVPREIAMACASSVLASDVDCAVSLRMKIDHGFAQPLEFLTGTLDRYPVIPVFINAAAPPLPSFRRVRMLGESIGRFAGTLGKRVAFIASGGLSHNPPVPMLDTAPPEVAERLIAGRDPDLQIRLQRQDAVIRAAQQMIRGESPQTPLNPDWDEWFLDVISSRNLEAFDDLQSDEVTRKAGNSAHEVKSWVAAAAAMRAITGGQYSMHQPFYDAIPEWIAGFATLQADGLLVAH